MNILKKSLLLLILPLLAFTGAHKFYLSVTNIAYSEKEEALQVTTRIFIDDLEKVLAERYDVIGLLGTDAESPMAKEYVEKYLKTKFVVHINGKKIDFDFLGKEYDNDMTICYIEIPQVNLDTLKTIQIQNEILMDLYDEQQNVVHFKLKDKKKSFVLIKSDTKGMLNL